MGEVYVRTATDWKKGIPHTGTGRGYQVGKSVWRNNNGTWVKIWDRVPNPPLPPTLDVSLVSGTKNYLKVSLRVDLSETPFNKVIVKVGINKTPVGPETNDGTFYSTISTSAIYGNEKWSEWFTPLWRSTLNNVGSIAHVKDFPITGINPIPLDTNVIVSAWVQDIHFQWSQVATKTIRTLKPDPAPAPAPAPKPAPAPAPKPTPVERKVELSASWYRSYRGNNAHYTWADTAPQKAMQGRFPQDTYGNGILRSLIGFPSVPQAIGGGKIKKVEVYLHMTHWYYYAGGTVHIRCHHYSSAPSVLGFGDGKLATGVVATRKYTRRDYGQWIELPSWLYWGFENGVDKGIALYAESTSGEYYGYADPWKAKLRVTYER